MKTFISYAHNDKSALAELRKHLALLLREGLLEDFHDRNVLGGAALHDEIAKQLEAASLFLPLISHNFFASDYCHLEMTRALERHKDRKTQVVPIIIEPCDWKNSPLGHLKALPEDGKPISAWSNKNEAFSNVVEELRRIIKIALPNAANESVAVNLFKSDLPQYKIKRDFSETDRSNFCREAFDKMQRYFRDAARNLTTVSNLEAYYNSYSETSFGCRLLNKLRNHGPVYITVHQGGRAHFGDIYYSYEEQADKNKAQGIFWIESDDYDMFFVTNGFGLDTKSFTGFGPNSKGIRLSLETAAPFLWHQFLEKAGITLA